MQCGSYCYAYMNQQSVLSHRAAQETHSFLSLTELVDSVIELLYYLYEYMNIGNQSAVGQGSSIDKESGSATYGSMDRRCEPHCRRGIYQEWAVSKLLASTC